jgi:nucleoside-diphosphate kinase
MIERTLIIIKPDGVHRRLVGEIIGRFEKKGLKIVAARFMQIRLPLAKKLYAIHKGQVFYTRLVKYIVSGPVLVMVLEGQKVIAIVRKMLGATIGSDALPGTIRGDFAIWQPPNLVHGSDSAKSAKKEIRLFFKLAEILNYKMTDEDWF